MSTRNILLGILLVVVFLVGFVVGRFSSVGSSYVPAPQSGGTTAAPISTGTTSVPEGGTTVDTSSLSDGQRAMLKALGIDADSIVVTPEMVVCAEVAVGAARAEEIKNGATPSFSEGLKLVGCYR